MSDIHGMFHLLKKMLVKIQFSDRDRLYILGDMIDRGPDPAGVLDLVSRSRNITALRGNHEDFFAEWYTRVEDKTENRYPYNTYDVMSADEETEADLARYVKWMKRLPLYKKLKMPGACCLLAHASTEGILQFWKRSREGFLWDSSMVDRRKGIPGYVSVVGHVPTFIIRGYPGTPATIWHSPDGTLIDVDCGAAFADCGGRLGCLCLETGEEFYVSEKEDGRRESL